MRDVIPYHLKFVTNFFSFTHTPFRLLHQPRAINRPPIPLTDHVSDLRSFSASTLALTFGLLPSLSSKRSPLLSPHHTHSHMIMAVARRDREAMQVDQVVFMREKMDKDTGKGEAVGRS